MNDAIEVSERDRERLLELISEYAGKLRQACDKYQANRLSSIVNLIFAFGLTAACGLAALGFGLYTHDVLANLKVGVFGVAAAGAAFFDIVLVQVTLSRRRQDRFSVTPLVSALERLVSRAAFLEDHAATNEDERLVTTLRIAEGEAALEYAAWVLRKPRATSGEADAPSRRYRSQVSSL